MMICLPMNFLFARALTSDSPRTMQGLDMHVRPADTDVATWTNS